MNIDVLVLNTAVTDLRRREFDFADNLVGKGGLAKCRSKDMPPYNQEQIEKWIQEGSATAGGSGNSAPLMAKAGLAVAICANLGHGCYPTSDGLHHLDAQGQFFYEQMLANGVEMSGIAERLWNTGTTFIHEAAGESNERGGIAYFPNANNDFDFDYAKAVVDTLRPRIVYYIYSGLSEKGDANNGRDLAKFIRWCRMNGSLTIADSHTLTADPGKAIREGRTIREYKLLEHLLPEVDIFFTSDDEGKLMANALGGLPCTKDSRYNPEYTQRLANRIQWVGSPKVVLERVRLFGVTVRDGAHYLATGPNGEDTGKVGSRFMPGEVVDLVGAGDAFRAGLLTYIAKNLQNYKQGTLPFEEAIEMGNLFAALFIKADLKDRYRNIKSYPTMLEIARNDKQYHSFAELQADLCR